MHRVENPHRRDLVAAACVAAAAVMALLAFLRLGMHGSPPVWLAELDRQEPMERGPPEMFPDAYWNECQYIEMDIERRPMWGDSEVDELIDHLNARYPEDTFTKEGRTPDKLGQAWVWEAAMGSVYHRLRYDGPVEPVARTRLIQWLTDRGLSDPDYSRVTRIADALVSARLIEDPAIRAKVEALKAHPDPEVGSTVGRWLEWYDRKQTAVARGAVPASVR